MGGRFGRFAITPFRFTTDPDHMGGLVEAAMINQGERVTKRISRESDRPGYIWHPSFDSDEAIESYTVGLLLKSPSYDGSYMPDELTRDHSRRMHYTGHLIHQARSRQDQNRWQQAYFSLRDQIVLGNSKLVNRAVRKRMAMSNRTDDLVGDCQIVLIQAAVAFDPWLNVRFSTYAYTCLIRALGRMSQRSAADVLTRALSLESSPHIQPPAFQSLQSQSGFLSLDEFFRRDHPLLSEREKAILSLRFNLKDEAAESTLEQVGRNLGLSKERVRQVQASALDKLRRALAESEVRS